MAKACTGIGQSMATKDTGGTEALPWGLNCFVRKKSKEKKKST